MHLPPTASVWSETLETDGFLTPFFLFLFLSFGSLFLFFFLSFSWLPTLFPPFQAGWCRSHAAGVWSPEFVLLRMACQGLTLYGGISSLCLAGGARLKTTPPHWWQRRGTHGVTLA